MNRQTLLALILAAAAALLTYYYLHEQEAALKADAAPVKVLTAKKPIPRGGVLTDDKVAITEVPGAYVMPGAIAGATSQAVIKQWETFRGQFAIVPVAKGEQVLPNKLSKILPGFAGVVPDGQRIIALALDPAAAVGGLVKPGHRVDVLGTFDYQQGGTKKMTTVVLAQNLWVTAVGTETAADRPKDKPADPLTGGHSVCLAVSPEEAVRLTLAEKEGALKLALRSTGDESVVELTDENLGSVLGPLLRLPKDAIRSSPKQIQIIRGMQ